MPSGHRDREEVRVRAPRTPRDDPNLSLPPSVKQNFGALLASQFIQVRLPVGYVHEGKASRALSYCDPHGTPIQGGTRRTVAVAKAALESWCWQWWESLLNDKKQILEQQDSGQLERPAKKQNLEGFVCKPKVGADKPRNSFHQSQSTMG